MGGPEMKDRSVQYTVEHPLRINTSSNCSPECAALKARLHAAPNVRLT